MDWRRCLLPGRGFWTVKSLWASSGAAGTGCKTGWLAMLRLSLLTWSLSLILLQAVRGHVAHAPWPLCPSCAQVKSLPSLS